MTKYNYTYAETEKDIPTTPHYAVLESKTIHEDDGYGGTHTVKAWNYLVFTDKYHWAQYVSDQKLKAPRSYSAAPDMIAMHVTPATVTVNVSVDVKVDV